MLGAEGAGWLGSAVGVEAGVGVEVAVGVGVAAGVGVGVGVTVGVAIGVGIEVGVGVGVGLVGEGLGTAVGRGVGTEVPAIQAPSPMTAAAVRLAAVGVTFARSSTVMPIECSVSLTHADMVPLQSPRQGTMPVRSPIRLASFLAVACARG